MHPDTVFIDTGAYLAHFHPKDQSHKQALKVWTWIETQRIPRVTTNHVLDELATILARRTSYAFSAMKMREIYRANLQIERPSARAEQEALDLFEKYADQKISFTDCLSFVTMQHLGVTKAFTFDKKHFEYAGFQVIPSLY